MPPSAGSASPSKYGIFLKTATYSASFVTTICHFAFVERMSPSWSDCRHPTNAHPGRASAVNVNFDPLVYSPVPAAKPPCVAATSTPSGFATVTVTLFVVTVSPFLGLNADTAAFSVLPFRSLIVTVHAFVSPNFTPCASASCRVKNSSFSTVLSVLAGMVITFSPTSPSAHESVSGNFRPPFGVSPSTFPFANSTSDALAVLYVKYTFTLLDLSVSPPLTRTTASPPSLATAVSATNLTAGTSTAQTAYSTTTPSAAAVRFSTSAPSAKTTSPVSFVAQPRKRWDVRTNRLDARDEATS